MEHTIQYRVIEEQDRDLLAGFRSGNSNMDSFLRDEAYSEYITRESSTTLVFCNGELVGYFTLKQGAFTVSEDDQTSFEQRSLDLARLAVHRTWQRKGIGTRILAFVLGLAEMCNERFVYLDALWEVKEFYVKRGFKPLIEDEYKHMNDEGLVAMIMDTYDPVAISEYFGVSVTDVTEM